MNYHWLVIWFCTITCHQSEDVGNWSNMIPLSPSSWIESYSSSSRRTSVEEEHKKLEINFEVFKTKADALRYIEEEKKEFAQTDKYFTDHPEATRSESKVNEFQLVELKPAPTEGK